ncbi:MAG: hypothetical protein PHW25_06625 [Zoogloea sp.]|uniref:hypothetical protein n=1 Tax=Zoogloea sp. TaxID=49181 RepID=UPI002606F759|nr:hypothetical protein [Zoogloea sp.]MDD3326740.1 hypothetical protein [Zoogloea sp.]
MNFSIVEVSRNSELTAKNKKPGIGSRTANLTPGEFYGRVISVLLHVAMQQS